MNAISMLRHNDTRFDPAAAPRGPSTCRRVTVTVLMCDIVSSTRLSTTLPVDTFRNLLLDYYRICDDIICAQNGHTARYVGDGIMSVFGEPFVEAGTAFDAVRAGLNICRQQFDHRGCRYEVRVAASTGEVATGARLGTDPALQDAIFGTAPYLVARLQTVAPPSSLVVDQATYEQIEAHFSTRWMGFQNLRGFADPQPAWQVEALKGLSSKPMPEAALLI